MKKCPRCGDQYERDTRFCTRDGQTLVDVAEKTPTPETELTVKMKPTQDDPMIGRVIAGRYRLIEKLGQGGMGAVYKGQHVKINRLTAIKVLTTELVSNQEFIARFQREAEMASQIDHPNAVAIYDFGEAEDGLIYIAMEYVNGKPLSAILKKDGTIALERVVRIARQAAEALSAAHNLGIIHRDFKPDNIMICDKPGRPDWVEVVDFGIAKRAVADTQQAGLTQAGFVLGTPLYMSPEQVMGEELDARSDLYSLALVVYEMLTCALPFSGSTTQSQMMKRVMEAPMPLTLARPQLTLPPAVEAVILRALSRKPEDRYTSTTEFAEALELAFRYNPATRPQAVATRPQEGPTRPANNPPANSGPRPIANQNTPPQQIFAPPNTRPNTPIHNTPYPQHPTPMPYQPAYPPQQQSQYPYYPPQQNPNKTRNTVIIIVAVILSLMGGCVVLGIIGMNAKKKAASSSYLQTKPDATSSTSQSSSQSSSNSARVSGGNLAASAIKSEDAVYPPLARSAKVTGAVVVEITVDERGDVVSANAVSGHPLLRNSAVAAARRWKFTPKTVGGVPTKTVGTITFNFN
ncbi:MAG: TonB family protein [Blastocatellia bacterium]